MGSAREIRSRVASIRNTQKVTRAMQMVAAAKMQRAVRNVLDIRPYANGARGILRNITRAMKNTSHPLLEERSVSRVLVVVIASNRGLCGPFNVSILKRLRALLADTDRLFSSSEKEDFSKRDIDIVAIGRKAEKMAISLGKNLVASFPDLMHAPTFDEAGTVGNILVKWYEERRYDRIFVIYTDYVSALSQRAKVRQVMPVDVAEFLEELGEMDNAQREVSFSAESAGFEYLVEPSPREVLDALLPALVRTQIYHMVLESNASKESSRMVAMKGATDAAGEIAEELMLVYNSIRQAKITQEIAEISAGRSALE